MAHLQLQAGSRCPRAVCRAVRVREAPRYLTLPNITYSNSKGDICLQELQQLYQAVCQSQQRKLATPTQQSFFQHWETLSAPEAADKLQLLLDRSVAVAAAFTRGPDLYEVEADEQGRAPSTSGRNSSRVAGTAWGPFAWRQRLPRRLVGFARAAGDSALVATVHDVIIHPGLQGFGLGSTLIKRLLAQISSEDVYDVGLVSPSNLQSFFHSCSFDLDREDSVPMALRHTTWDRQDINSQQLQANQQLLQLLQSRKTSVDVDVDAM